MFSYWICINRDNQLEASLKHGQLKLPITKWNREGGKGWCSGESARLPPMWPGFKSRRRRHMWVEFVVGSLLCSERFFSGYSGFSLSSKTNISKFQFDQESDRRRTALWMCYLQIIIYLFIYLFKSIHVLFVPGSMSYTCMEADERFCKMWLLPLLNWW